MSSAQTGGANFEQHSIQAAGKYTAERPVTYQCGDCGIDVTLSRGSAIRCTSCGHRVLMKKRTERMVQFEAR